MSSRSRYWGATVATRVKLHEYSSDFDPLRNRRFCRRKARSRAETRHVAMQRWKQEHRGPAAVGSPPFSKNSAASSAVSARRTAPRSCRARARSRRPCLATSLRTASLGRHADGEEFAADRVQANRRIFFSGQAWSRRDAMRRLLRVLHAVSVVATNRRSSLAFLVRTLSGHDFGCTRFARCYLFLWERSHGSPRRRMGAAHASCAGKLGPREPSRVPGLGEGPMVALSIPAAGSEPDARREFFATTAALTSLLGAVSPGRQTELRNRRGYEWRRAAKRALEAFTREQPRSRLAHAEALVRAAIHARRLLGADARPNRRHVVLRRPAARPGATTDRHRTHRRASCSRDGPEPPGPSLTDGSLS